MRNILDSYSYSGYEKSSTGLISPNSSLAASQLIAGFVLTVLLDKEKGFPTAPDSGVRSGSQF